MCTGCPYERKNETEPILTVKHGELVWLLGEGENGDEGRSADYKDLSQGPFYCGLVGRFRN